MQITVWLVATVQNNVGLNILSKNRYCQTALQGETQVYVVYKKLNLNIRTHTSYN